MTNSIKTLLESQDKTKASELLDTVNKFKDGTADDYKTEKAKFTKACKDKVLSYAGNVTKQYEEVSVPFAYALAEVMAFHSSNNLAQLYYKVTDPVNDMGNKTIAAGIKNISLEVFGIQLSYVDIEKVKDGKDPWKSKNVETDIEKGTIAPKDMPVEPMHDVIKLLENGGFKELLVAYREDVQSKPKSSKDLSPLALSKEMKVDPNVIKAVSFAKQLFTIKELSDEGISNISLKRIANKMEALCLEANELELSLMDKLAKKHTDVNAVSDTANEADNDSNDTEATG